MKERELEDGWVEAENPLSMGGAGKEERKKEELVDIDEMGKKEGSKDEVGEIGEIGDGFDG